jgi:Gpi18-like mannosyltransferase
MLFFASKPKLSVMVFTVGLLTKPQSIALAPLIAFLIFRKYGWRGLFTSLLVATATIFIVIIPFEWTNPISFLTNIYFGAYAGYEVTTMNALNLWALGGFWASDTATFLFLNLAIIGWIMFGGLAVFTLYFLRKRVDASNDLLILFSAFLLSFGFFMLPTRIHERYLFPVPSLLTLMFPFIRRVRPLYGVLSFTYLANQVYALQFLKNGEYIPLGDPVVWSITLVNLITFLYALALMYKSNTAILRLSLTQSEP